MFNWIWAKEPTETEKEITRLCELRAKAEPTSDAYQKLNVRIRELMEQREMEKKPKFQVSGDTVLKVGAMVAVCALIVFREELVGPVTSKALSLAAKIV